MPDVATNRQASYRFNLLDKWECGIVLTGTEVKSLRNGKATLKDGYAKVEIALARGKDQGDKRQAIKERELKREMERSFRR